MHNFKAPPMRRAEIRQLANDLRQKLGMAHNLWFPVLEFAEQVLPSMDPNYYFQVVEEEELGSSHGMTISYGKDVAIQIRQDVYERAYRDEGRDRGTVAHEVGHYLMHARTTALHRNFGGVIQTCEDPEWQAKCFQGELLIPRHLVRGMRVDEVARACGVSADAARYQLNLYADGK
ncbi:MAG TPA: ImmA/IrrE family metallo-endopeptidase [Herbaspirillum sp.]|uniref:ImmA/IrrE family metallo-endopeptidase n=1 Tax=Herbaspirillum sp. TaxID=1890675 RepID=UPI002D548BDD|nr:ImmA/IrrE family metallo-endopeptidase [Herbaspirillum sp.]HZG20587.1 ImmA/IrrE family metallo-endopeptidase [Herbaspirillum sp.]